MASGLNGTVIVYKFSVLIGLLFLILWPKREVFHWEFVCLLVCLPLPSTLKSGICEAKNKSKEVTTLLSMVP